MRSHDKRRHVIEVAVAHIVILGQHGDDELLRALGLVAAAISYADTKFSGAVDFPALILEPPDQLHSHDLTYHRYLYQFPFRRQKSSLKRKVFEISMRWEIKFRNLATKPPKFNVPAVQMFILPLFALFTDRESIDRYTITYNRTRTPKNI
uniref:Uncharacterized protein n=1 Tax=Glossina pallidipes TaxID=7398 RepID=A0A1B0A080_GLOPL